MNAKKITKVEINLLPVGRDNNGNPIVPLELVSIKNKVKYIKEKTEELLQLNRSTVNEREIEVQIINIKECLDRLLNPILFLRNQYKEEFNAGHLREKLKKEYGCTQEEWERNFTYSDEFNIEDSLKNYLKYLENNIKVMYPMPFYKYFKKAYRECKKHIEGTKQNISSTILFIKYSMRLLINIENVIKDLAQNGQLDKTKKESLYIEISKSSIAAYLNRLYTVLDLSINKQSEAMVKGVIAPLKNIDSATKDHLGSALFIKKAISFGSVRKAEKVFLMKKDEWDEFIENTERIDYGEVVNKLFKIFGNILEYAKNKNFEKEALDETEAYIRSIDNLKEVFFMAGENINKLELGIRPEVNRHISSDVKQEVWQRDQGHCVQCGSQLNLEFDHIIPVSKGGSNTARNIQLLCEKCNREKYNNI